MKTVAYVSALLFPTVLYALGPLPTEGGPVPAEVSPSATEAETPPTEVVPTSIEVALTPAEVLPPPTEECVPLPRDPISFDQITSDTVRSWLPTLRFVTNPQHLSIDTSSTGNAAIRQRFIPSERGSEATAAASDLEPARAYALRQEIQFEQGFDWGGISETGKIGFGLGGGSSPSGGNTQTDGFTARLIWEGNNDGTARLGAYLYTADRTHNFPYGDAFLIDNFDIPTSTWIDVTLMATMNSSLDVADGSLAIWIGNELKLRRTDILWQSSGETPMVDRLSLASFYGGNTADFSPSFITHAKIRDVCFAKQ